MIPTLLKLLITFQMPNRYKQVLKIIHSATQLARTSSSVPTMPTNYSLKHESHGQHVRGRWLYF